MLPILSPDPYTIFARARHAWVTQSYPRAVQYVVGLQALGVGNALSKHYESTYVARTNRVYPDRVSLEQQAHPHVPRGINISLGPIPIGPREETPDPFGIPSLAPNYSFGIAPPIRSDSVDTNALIAQLRAQYPDPMAKDNRPKGGLQEIGNVVAVHRDYVMQFVGIENDARGEAFHLTLQPTHDAWHFRLRDVWIDTATYHVHQLISAGNFTGGLAVRAQWMVKFREQGGLQYLQSEQTLGPVSASSLLGLSSEQWDGWRVEFSAVQPGSDPSYLAPSLGGEKFLSEPE